MSRSPPYISMLNAEACFVQVTHAGNGFSCRSKNIATVCHSCTLMDGRQNSFWMTFSSFMQNTQKHA